MVDASGTASFYALDGAGHAWDYYQGSWHALPSYYSFTDLSAGRGEAGNLNSKLWGIGTDGRLYVLDYYWWGPAWVPADVQGTHVKEISATRDNRCFALTPSGQIVLYTDGQPNYQRPITWYNDARSISASVYNGQTVLYFITSNPWGGTEVDRVYATAFDDYGDPLYGSWLHNFTKVSTTANGGVYALDSGGNVFVWNEGGHSWQQLDSNVTAISAGTDSWGRDVCYDIHSSQDVYEITNFGAVVWMNATASEISGSDGLVWRVDLNHAPSWSGSDGYFLWFQWNGLGGWVQ
jgi:hypothetical protein